MGKFTRGGSPPLGRPNRVESLCEPSGFWIGTACPSDKVGSVSGLDIATLERVRVRDS